MIKEELRFPAPGPDPLGIAFDGTNLWVSSREAHRVYTVDPATRTVTKEFEAPGAPFGIAVGGDEFRVVVGFGNDDDDRYIYRFAPGQGFKNERIACPDLSGVHLAIDGDTLYLSQAHNKKILALDDRGAVVREISLERRPVGMVLNDGVFHLITTGEDFKNPELTRVDARGAAPQVTSVAPIPFRARGLAFDGERYWAGERDKIEIVAFAKPS